MKNINTGLLTLSLCTGFLGALVPVTFAQGTTKKPSAKMGSKHKMSHTASEVKYKAHCGMIYSAADAKKNHYICPMDHKPLVKMASATPGGQHKK